MLRFVVLSVAFAVVDATNLSNASVQTNRTTTTFAPTPPPTPAPTPLSTVAPTPAPTPAPWFLSAWFNPDNPYVTALDEQVARWAHDASNKWCDGEGFHGGAMSKEDSGHGRDELEAELGGSNVFLDVLKDAEPFVQEAGKEQDIMWIMWEEIQEGWFKFKAGPLVMFLVMMILWSCCFSWTACCTKCRISKPKERKRCTDRVFCCKLPQCVVLFACTLTVLLTTASTHVAYGSVKDGVHNLACSTTKLLDTALNGQRRGGNPNEHFIGLVPTLQKLWFIDTQMQPNSPLLIESEEIIEQTRDIEESLVLFSDTTKLLGAMTSEESGNLLPAAASDIENQTLLHECQLCAALNAAVDDIQDALIHGISNALFKARNEVKLQMNLSKRLELQQALSEGFNLMNTTKNQLRDVLEPMVDPNSFDEKFKVDMENVVYWPLFAILFVAFGFLLLACCATRCWMKRETIPDSLPVMYSNIPHRTACCVWFWACPFLALVFLVSGMMNIVVLPWTGLCLTLADMNSALLQDIAPALPSIQGVNFSGDEGEIIGDVTDICLAGHPGRSDNLLDIIWFRDFLTQQKMTLRQTLVEMTREPVEKAFKEIQDLTLNMDNSMVNSSAFETLEALFAVPVEATLLPDEQSMRNDPRYVDLALESTLSVGFKTSTTCNDHTFQGQVIPGMATFVTRLKTFGIGTGITSHGCIEKVVCTGSNSTQGKACEAGNRLLDLKIALIDGTPNGQNIFRCDGFIYPVNGTSCDPTYMVEGANFSWSDDCLRDHEAGYVFTETEETTCNLYDFSEYIMNYSTRLDRLVKRLDASSVHSFNRVFVDLRSVINTNLLDIVGEVADGITCSFMPPLYKEVVDGLCYQGLAGFRVVATGYVYVAVAMLFLSVLMYFLWRVALDNTIAEYFPDDQVDTTKVRTKYNRKERIAKAARMIRLRRGKTETRPAPIAPSGVQNEENANERGQAEAWPATEAEAAPPLVAAAEAAVEATECFGASRV